jgi:hypothetical protein
MSSSMEVSIVKVMYGTATYMQSIQDKEAKQAAG